MTRLSGQTAIVTGASKGIGEAIATGFAAEGANVVVNSRSPERAAEAAEEIEAVAEQSEGAADGGWTADAWRYWADRGE